MSWRAGAELRSVEWTLIQIRRRDHRLRHKRALRRSSNPRLKRGRKTASTSGSYGDVYDQNQTKLPFEAQKRRRKRNWRNPFTQSDPLHAPDRALKPSQALWPERLRSSVAHLENRPRGRGKRANGRRREDAFQCWSACRECECDPGRKAKAAKIARHRGRRAPGAHAVAQTPLLFR